MYTFITINFVGKGAITFIQCSLEWLYSPGHGALGRPQNYYKVREKNDASCVNGLVLRVEKRTSWMNNIGKTGDLISN